MDEKRWRDMERHLRLHRTGPAPKASYPVLLTAEQLDLCIEAVQAMDRRAEPTTGEVEALVRAFEDSVIEICRGEAHRPTQRYAAARDALLAALRGRGGGV